MKKIVVVYSKAHAESIVSAARVMVDNPAAIAVEVSDTKALSEALKGKKGDNVVYRFVDDMDERHLKADTVHYMPPHDEKEKEVIARRVVQMYGDNKIPYVVNVIADHIHNQEPEVYKAAILADYSDLSSPQVVQSWRVLFSDNLNAINALKAVGEPIARYIAQVGGEAEEAGASAEEIAKVKEDAQAKVKKAQDDAKAKIKAAADKNKEKMDKLKADHKEKVAKASEKSQAQIKKLKDQLKAAKAKK